MDNFLYVGEFHEKFGLDNCTYHRPGPRNLPPDAIEFRKKFMREELDEFSQACADGDQAKAFDALLDLVYVAMGTAHLMGFPWHQGFNEVQRANMTKERATHAGDPRSVRGHALDVVKPLNFIPPDLVNILKNHGWFKTCAADPLCPGAPEQNTLFCAAHRR